MRIMSNFFILIIKFYKYFISPYFHSNCRYLPTCSEYFIDALKLNGIFILVCPSKNYDAGKIIEESIELVRVKRGYFAAMIKKIFLYPLTKYLGLNFIQKQLKSGNWMAYSIEVLSNELIRAGFTIQPVKVLYGGAAYLICCNKMRGLLYREIIKLLSIFK